MPLVAPSKSEPKESPFARPAPSKLTITPAAPAKPAMPPGKSPAPVKQTTPPIFVSFPKATPAPSPAPVKQATPPIFVAPVKVSKDETPIFLPPITGPAALTPPATASITYPAVAQKDTPASSVSLSAAQTAAPTPGPIYGPATNEEYFAPEVIRFGPLLDTAPPSVPIPQPASPGQSQAGAPNTGSATALFNAVGSDVDALKSNLAAFATKSNAAASADRATQNSRTQLFVALGVAGLFLTLFLRK